MTEKREIRFHGRIIEAVTLDFWATLAHDTTYEERRRIRRERTHAWYTAQGVMVSLATITALLDEFSRIWHDEWMTRQRTPNALDAADYLLASHPVGQNGEARAELAAIIDDSLLAAPPVPVEGALAAVHRLAEVFPLALVCDTGLSGAKNIDALIREWGLDDLLKVRAYSEQVGVSKPHPKMFFTALEGLGVPQHRTVHIGDLDPTDIHGAKNLGMAAIRFDGAKEQAACKPCSMADDIFSSWEEILEALLGKPETA